MLQVMGKQPAATRLSRTLFLTYAISAVPLTILFSVYMTMTSL